MAKKTTKDPTQMQGEKCDQSFEMQKPLLKQQNIEDLIYVVRNRQVMFDRDLAKLYQVETGQLNRQVKRNIERFPSDFLFQLTKEEMAILKCQNGTASWGGDRHFPYAFTENGVAMLSGILRSETAVDVNIRIMRAFTAMRHFLANNVQLFQRLSNIEYHQIETDHRIDEVFKQLNANTQPQQGIFFDGQVFDAYRYISNLVRKAKKSIVLVDNYVDDTVLTLLDKRKDGVSATIYTQNISQQLRLDIARHNAQYAIIDVQSFNKAHDRFLLIDEEAYHIGASIKDLGKKWFAFTLLRDMTAAELLKKIQTA